MRFSPKIFLLFVLVIGCVQADPDPSQAPADWDSNPYPTGKDDIYGEDSRFEINDPNVDQVYRDVAESTAVIFSTRSIFDSTANGIRLNPTTMSAKQLRDHGAPLCSTERFRGDAAPGFCTGFLIAPDLVATAGHCINGHTDCAQLGFGFGFAKDRPGDSGLEISDDDFYRCQHVVGHEYNQGEPGTTTSELWQDWAVVKLDRPVRGRVPLPVAYDQPPAVREVVTAVGHPAGLAMKATMGRVVSSSQNSYFNTDLDIYQGNSGSPVVDREGVVRGIVIRGSGGNSFTKVNGCYESDQCDEVGGSTGCIGNHVLRPEPLRAFQAEDLKINLKHELVSGDVDPTFQDEHRIEADGEIVFVTVNINAFSNDPSKLKIDLERVGGSSVNLITNGKKLRVGTSRYTRTTHVFDGENAGASWRLKIEDGGQTDSRVSWWQVIVGTSSNGVITTTRGPWIGTSCETDGDCTFTESGAAGLCYAYGTSDEFGFCTVACEGFCPDRSGYAGTFCIGSDTPQVGICASVPAASNNECLDIEGTVLKSHDRFIGNSSAAATTRDVCAP